MKTLILAALLVAMPAVAREADISGVLRVTDADTVEYAVTGRRTGGVTEIAFDDIHWRFRGNTVYAPGKTGWERQNTGTVFARMTLTGALDQFVALEMLFGVRTGWYDDYVQYGEEGDFYTVRAVFSPEAYAAMFESWLQSLPGVLNATARRVVRGLDAQSELVFYFCKSDGQVVRVDTETSFAPVRPQVYAGRRTTRGVLYFN